MSPLKWPAVWLTGGWLLVAAIVYLSLARLPDMPSAPGADKTAHIAAYALMMFWFMQIYTHRAYRVATALFLAALGVGLEILQGMTAYRAFEYADMIANLSGILVGWAAAPPRTANLLMRIEKTI